jgi:hypothetical protein
MDHVEREAVRTAARRAVEKDEEQHTDYARNWLETQRVRLAQLKASVVELEDIIAIYEAALTRPRESDHESLNVPARIDPTLK